MGPIPSHDSEGEIRYFLDLYICSYTPILSALIQSRNRDKNRDFGSRSLSRPSLLLEAQPDPSPPTVGGEIQVVQALDTEIPWLPPSDTIFRTVLDPSSGPRSPHHEFIFAEYFASFVVKSPRTGRYMMIASNLITPTSRAFPKSGTVTLNSASSWQAAVDRPGAAQHKVLHRPNPRGDQRHFAASPGWDGYIIGQFGDLATAKTDDGLEAYASARRNAATVFHPVGTAARYSSTAVIDPHLVVKGPLASAHYYVLSIQAYFRLFLPRIHRLSAPRVLYSRRATEPVT
ncbi:hypothetical protein EDB86DRAFT_3243576 [Lactarius hatsudake]|nr:hypothetical protein EDB86DRAFT_3243576 [Lactarius hatsudake]